MKKILISLVISFFFLITASNSFAFILSGNPCYNGPGSEQCISGYSCQTNNAPPPAAEFTCQPDVFGKIKPPAPLAEFVKKDPSGAGTISQFLSNFVNLIFSVAAIALIAMFLWGAFEWMTAGGDKEKLSSARKRIINAIIGLILFATTFAILRVLGQVTGFELFGGQSYTVFERTGAGGVVYKCRSGKMVYPPANPDIECKKP